MSFYTLDIVFHCVTSRGEKQYRARVLSVDQVAIAAHHLPVDDQLALDVALLVDVQRVAGGVVHENPAVGALHAVGHINEVAVDIVALGGAAALQYGALSCLP